MEVIQELNLRNAPKTYMSSGDVLLVDEDGIAIVCHSQILSLHSSVFCKMFEDLASERGKRTRIPLPGFTGSQCLDVLAYLYRQGPAYAAYALLQSLNALQCYLQ